MYRSISVIAALTLGSTVIPVNAASAATPVCGISSADQGDSLISASWTCDAANLAEMWNDFSMNGSWDASVGADDPCDDDLPLKRMYNALQLLQFGVTDSPTCDTTEDNMATWAYCWAADQHKSMRVDCATTSIYVAYTSWFTGITYYSGFFNQNVIERASIVFHEARHAEGCTHPRTGCPIGRDCERGWDDGCHNIFGGGTGPGAYTYQVAFLYWFLYSARSGWINSALRAGATNYANWILESHFENDPCFRVASDGSLYSTC